ncbi:MAG: Uma2 family endonuclease [Candidatus Dormibacteria bacterium]
MRPRFAPPVLNLRELVTAADLRRLSGDNPGWQFERSAEGKLRLSPTNSRNGLRNVELIAQLVAWNRRVHFGKVFDSSSGFTMPDGAVLSPDGSCIRAERWNGLTAAQQDSYAPLCPDVCIEIASSSDRWPAVCTKIDDYASYGATYALALDPATRQRYERGAPPGGLTLDLDAIFDA